MGNTRGVCTQRCIDDKGVLNRQDLLEPLRKIFEVEKGGRGAESEYATCFRIFRASRSPHYNASSSLRRVLPFDKMMYTEESAEPKKTADFGGSYVRLSPPGLFLKNAAVQEKLQSLPFARSFRSFLKYADSPYILRALTNLCQSEDTIRLFDRGVRPTRSRVHAVE